LYNRKPKANSATWHLFATVPEKYDAQLSHTSGRDMQKQVASCASSINRAKSIDYVRLHVLPTNCLEYSTCPDLAGRSSRDDIPTFSAQRSILRLRLVVFLQELMVLVATNACSELLRRVCEINMEAICLRLGYLLYLTHLHLLSKTSPRAHFTSNL
jgi:hypothetical protein